MHSSKITLIFILIEFIYCHYANIEFKIVKTDAGLVRGKQLLTLFENKSYYAFKGIPYAKPPIKDLRFKPPIPPEHWDNVRDTLEFGNECIQQSSVMDLTCSEQYILGDEDCLYINIYTPDITLNLPVMFFIHGGGYLEGSANMYGPDFIINQNDIVLVTINYRVGIFGFLSFNTPEYSGNMALKDQLLALKWVHKNIRNFGGNPDLITIFGESAGASSVHYHVVTQNNMNLFKRAIMMSGSIKNTWAIRPYNDHTLQMFEMARRIGKPVSEKNELIKFFLQIDARILLEHAFIQKYQPGLPRKTVTLLNYIPLIENPSANDPYMIVDPNEIIANDSYHSIIDTMFGFTSMEGFFIVHEETKDACLLKSFNKTFEFQLPLDQDVDIEYKSKEYKKIAKKVRHFYFGEGGEVNENSMLQYVDLQSALWFSYAVHASVRQQAGKSNGKTFYYVFSVENEANLSRKTYNITLPGATHFDDICYLFRCPLSHLYENFTENSIARKAIENMTKLWVNFAKYGDPSISLENINIKPIQHNVINYFNLSNAGIEVGRNPRKDMTDLWDDIYINHKNKYRKSTIKRL